MSPRPVQGLIRRTCRATTNFTLLFKCRSSRSRGPVFTAPRPPRLCRSQRPASPRARTAGETPRCRGRGEPTADPAVTIWRKLVVKRLVVRGVAKAIIRVVPSRGGTPAVSCQLRRRRESSTQKSREPPSLPISSPDQRVVSEPAPRATGRQTISARALRRSPEGDLLAGGRQASDSRYPDDSPAAADRRRAGRSGRSGGGVRGLGQQARNRCYERSSAIGDGTRARP